MFQNFEITQNICNSSISVRNLHANNWYFIWIVLGFPNSSVDKESACNAGDPGLIPGSGRSAGEGIGYPLQCSWASLVAQLVKKLPTVREIWVWSLGWEDALVKEPGRLQSMGSQSQTWLSNFTYLLKLVAY